MAYLLLGDKGIYQEVERNALEALKETDSEPLPALLLAYVSLMKKEEGNIYNWLSSAYEIAGEEIFLTCLQINEKLHVLWEPAFKFMEGKRRN